MNLCAIILAAGQGTRMKSDMPKVLHEVLGRPLVGHAVGLARSCGARKIVVVVGCGREAVESYLREYEDRDDLVFVVQEEQLGTAHAVQQAQAVLDDHDGWTLILTGDVPNLCPETMAEFVKSGLEGGTPLTFMSCHVPDPTGYGRILRDDAGGVLGNVEHRDATEAQRHIDEINVGFYLVDNRFLWKHLGNVRPENDQREFYLPDLFGHSRDAGGVTAYVVDDPLEVEGVNTRVQLAMAQEVARDWRNERLMLAGVTMIDPTTTYVDAFVELGRDVVLEPNVRLAGHTRIADNVVVRQGSIIEDSTLESGVLVKPYSHIESSIVRAGAQVGPFSHLRPASDIGPGAKVGNFVEIKKSVLGPGTKANHLSYLGDTTTGEACNIGAGTITCNYDGANKHPTVMGDRVFTGSNSSLVAPINLGDDAYVGAGSTMTKDVSSGALAVARGRQREIPGWVARSAPKKKSKG